MSANRDKSQSFLFLYKSNSIETGKEEKKGDGSTNQSFLSSPLAVTSGRVLRVENQNERSIEDSQSQSLAGVEELKKNLDTLEHLQAKLHFMLKELEALIKK